VDEIKHNIEAVLFAIGKKVHIDEIIKICKIDLDSANAALKELQKNYEERKGSIKLVQDNEFWKLSVDEKFVPVIQNLGVETELTKSVMETLAVIAWKYPILQNDVIHIRTNKAYDHLTELEERGFINRSKHGRTRTIRLTEKFFQYFDLPKDKAKNVFQELLPEQFQAKLEQAENDIISAEKLSQEIRKKEKIIMEQLKKEKKEQAQLEQGLEIEEKHVVIEDENTGQKVELENYESKDKPVNENKELEVVEVTENNKEIESSNKIEESKDEPITQDNEIPKSNLKVDEKAVDEAVERIIHPKK